MSYTGYAILGFARLGATRLGYHSGALLVQVGKKLLPARLGACRVSAAVLGCLQGADRLRGIEQTTLQISMSGQDTYPTASFAFKAPWIERPQSGEIVIVGIGTLRQRLFLGRLTTPQERERVNLRYRYECTAVGIQRDLERRRVFATYQEYTAKEILLLLFDTYTDGSYYLGPDIDDGAGILEITWNGETVLEALTYLADVSAFVFFVDETKTVHFKAKTETVAPYDIDDLSAFVRVEPVEDSSDIRNRIHVQYATLEPMIQTFVGDGEQDQFSLSEVVHSVLSLTVDGSPVTYGVRYKEDNDSNQFSIQYEQGYIAASTYGPLGVGEVLQIVYYGKVPTRTTYNAELSQAYHAGKEGSDGIYEHFLENLDIISNTDAQATALGMFAQYAYPLVSCTFERKEKIFTFYQRFLRVGMAQRLAVKGYNTALTISSIDLSIWKHADGVELGIYVLVSLMARQDGMRQFLEGLQRDQPRQIAQYTDVVDLAV